MASVHGEKRNGKTLQIVTFQLNGRRERIGLANVTKKHAEGVARNVQSIVSAKIAGQPIDTHTAAWLAAIDDKLHEKIALKGLIEPPDDTSEQANQSIADFVDGFIDRAMGAKADNTIRNWRNTRRKLTDYFGEGRAIGNITRGDATDWQDDLNGQDFASSTVSKATKHAKQFFDYAKQKEFLPDNPFTHLKATGEESNERLEYVERDVIAEVLEACPDTEWRAIVGLCRFAGLRCPSEVLKLTWNDINWEKGWFKVTSVKTKRFQKGFRTVPLFPDVRAILQDLFEIADDKAEFVITRYRTTNANLRTQLGRIIERAGVRQWGKVFQNLRSSLETELVDRFPLHVACGWIGNSPEVATKHYLQVTEKHFQKAGKMVFDFSGHIGGQNLSETGGNGQNPCPPVAHQGAFFLGNNAFSPEKQGLPIPPRGVEPLSSD